MKKLLILLTIFFFPFTVFGASFSSEGFAEGEYNGTWEVAGTTGGQDYYENAGVFMYYTNGGAPECYWLMSTDIGNTSTFKYYFNDGTCSQQPNEGTWLNYTGTPPAGIVTLISPPEPEGVAGLIETASSTIFNDLGFGLGDISSLMQTQLLLVMGSGLGLVGQLLPFIIAMVIIASIVYFIYRGLRFFNN